MLKKVIHEGETSKVIYQYLLNDQDVVPTGTLSIDNNGDISIYVHRSYRRQGIGTQLLLAALKDQKISIADHVVSFDGGVFTTGAIAKLAADPANRYLIDRDGYLCSDLGQHLPECSCSDGTA